MKLSVSNKTMTSKLPKEKMGAYFDGLTFEKKDVSLIDLAGFVGSGHSFTSLSTDESFLWRGYDMKDRYVGAQIMAVDIDGTVPDASFIDNAKYKPFLWHTSLSNGESGEFRIHLIYVFDGVIKGLEAWHYAFDMVTEDYKALTDRNHCSPLRVTFTSNSSLDGYHCEIVGQVLSIENTLPGIMTGNDQYNRPNGSDQIFSFNNLDQNIKINSSDQLIDPSVRKLNELTKKHTHTTLSYSVQKPNTFKLDPAFEKEYLEMNWEEFKKKYYLVFNVSNKTLVDFDGKPYYDLRGKDYFEVKPKFKWYDGKYHKDLVKEGNRHSQLMHDTLSFLACNPGITPEALLYAVTCEVRDYYYNGDGQMTPRYIMERVSGVWYDYDSGELKPTPRKRTMRVDMRHPDLCGKTKQEKVGMARQTMTDDEIGSMIDTSASLEKNIREMERHGVIHSKKRVLEFCERNGIELASERDEKNEKTENFVKANMDMSIRDIVKALKEKGVKTSVWTIQKMKKGIET